MPRTPLPLTPKEAKAVGYLKNKNNFLWRLLVGKRLRFMIDTEKLKAIDAEIVLGILGLPYKRIGNRIMATALYRDENTASISIQEKNQKYLWKDFGTGKGGSWIDLVMTVKSLGYLDAIKFLNNLENAEIINFQKKTDFSFDRQKEKSNKEKSNIVINEITTVADLNLINYLYSRSISYIPYWLKQINYTVFRRDKTYLNKAIGIGNSAGGYAIRNPNTKMNIGKSSYSLFTTDSKNGPIFAVEGLFDGLTIAEKMKDKDYNLIILNSTENLNNKVIEILNNYKFIIIGFDNDAAGINAENKIIGKIKDSEVYKLKFQANDLNEASVLKEKIEIARLK